MKAKDPKGYYARLKVDIDASASDIKTSYRTLARELHPDKNMEADAKEQFQALAEAYCGELTSAVRRRQTKRLRLIW
jgi:molecular chaperone DnaJ